MIKLLSFLRDVVWSAVFAQILYLGSIAVAFTGNLPLTLALALGAIASAILATRV